MDLRKLNIFITVCKYGSMSKAGENLYMSQPAISQAIHDLEEELNIKLFDRIKRQLILTHAGKTLLEYARRILLLVEEAENNISDIANMNRGRLRIGSSTTIGTYLLPKLIGEFKKSYQKIDIPFVIDNTQVIKDKILDYEIDVALVEGPVHSDDIIVKPCYDDQLYLICSKDHPWASRKIINPNEIKGENFIIREPGSGTREVIENTMAKHKLTYQIKHVLNNTETIIKDVEANIGISIVPKLAIQDKMGNVNFKKLDIKGVDFTRKFNIIYHKDKYISNIFKAFLDFLKI